MRYSSLNEISYGLREKCSNEEHETEEAKTS